MAALERIGLVGREVSFAAYVVRAGLSEGQAEAEVVSAIARVSQLFSTAKFARGLNLARGRVQLGEMKSAAAGKEWERLHALVREFFEMIQIPL